MAVDHYVSMVVSVPSKLVMSIDRLAAEYGLSRTNTIKRLLEEAVHWHGAPVEQSNTFKHGARNKHKMPATVNNALRNVL